MCCTYCCEDFCHELVNIYVPKPNKKWVAWTCLILNIIPGGHSLGTVIAASKCVSRHPAPGSNGRCGTVLMGFLQLITPFVGEIWSIIWGIAIVMSTYDRSLTTEVSHIRRVTIIEEEKKKGEEEVLIQNSERNDVKENYSMREQKENFQHQPNISTFNLDNQIHREPIDIVVVSKAINTKVKCPKKNYILNNDQIVVNQNPIKEKELYKNPTFMVTLNGPPFQFPYKYYNIFHSISHQNKKEHYTDNSMNTALDKDNTNQSIDIKTKYPLSETISSIPTLKTPLSSLYFLDSYEIPQAWKIPCVFKNNLNQECSEMKNH